MSLKHPNARLRARARRILRRLPRKDNIHRYPLLKYFAQWLVRFPFLWSYKSPHVLRAIYVGSIVTFLPIMGAQIVVGALLAVLFRANLPITAALQFVSNPLTGPVMYFASYQVGRELSQSFGFQSSGWASDAASFLTVGGLALGLVLGLAIDVGIRIYHHYHRRRIASFTQGNNA